MDSDSQAVLCKKCKIDGVVLVALYNSEWDSENTGIENPLSKRVRRVQQLSNLAEHLTHQNPLNPLQFHRVEIRQDMEIWRPVQFH